MKTLTLILCLLCAPATALFTSCANVAPPAQRVVAVQTLKSVGEAAEATVTLSAKLYADNKITSVQARAVFDFYNQKFQPAFRLAVAAVKADVSSAASPDLIALGLKLADLVPQFTTHSP